jgi:exopolysaccharide biosynthesis WecB/TagA/CpsF family protein
MGIQQTSAWPQKRNLFGVDVSVADYDQTVAAIIAAAQRREHAIATFLPVHGIVTAAHQDEFRRCVNQFQFLGADGQPVRWALNQFHHAGLRDRVYGPEVMKRVCNLAARNDLSVYLYGTTARGLSKLVKKLEQSHPRLKIAGTDAPPFRPLTVRENDDSCRRINDSGARILFISLGCPRQELFAAENISRINAVQLCVGAAFDFLAGTKRMAPRIMQRNGLEWLFRLYQEPRRLWRRYLLTNLAFSGMFAGALARSFVRPHVSDLPIHDADMEIANAKNGL